MFNKIALPLTLILLLVAVNVQAFGYDITYWANSTQGATGTATPPSFYSDQANSINLIQNIHLTFNLTSSPDTYTANYLSPYTVTYGQATNDLTANYSCLNLGSSFKSYSVGEVETRATISQDGATTNYITVGSRNIISNSNRYLTLDKSEEDTEAGASNIYARTVCEGAGAISQANVYNRLNSDNFGECLTNSLRRIGTTYALTCPSGFPKEFVYMVFNSSAGNISFSTEIFNSGSGNQQHLLYKFDEPTTIIDSCSSVDTCSGNNIGLTPNTLYVIGVGTLTTTGVQQTIDINVTIDTAQPDYICTEGETEYSCASDFIHCYSECDEATGQKTRTCTDANGLQPQKIELLSCDLIILENATIGFEEFETFDDIRKCIPTFVTGCTYNTQPTQISVDRPANWTVVEDPDFRHNFLSMSDDWATEGSRSVKLWYIPPVELGHPLPGSPNPSCGALEEGIIPQIFTGVNDTSFLAFNVTFPAENMLIKFDVKKCDEPPLKTDPVTTLFDVVELCPRTCYGTNCTEEPTGNYIFNIVDTSTGLSLLGTPFYGEALDLTKSPKFDLSDLGIQAGVTYTIVFAVSPPNNNLNYGNANCAYFDNVQYQVTEFPLTILVGDECISRCEGTTNLNARKLPNGKCLVIEEPFTDPCLEEAESEAVENLEDFCDDETTVAVYNPKTSMYQTVSCDFICQDGRCVTEEEVEDTPTSEDTPQNLLNEIFTFMLTRLFWAMAITGIFFILTLMATAKLGEASWIGATIISIMSLVFFIAVGWVALEVGALIILPIALLIVYEFRKAT